MIWLKLAMSITVAVTAIALYTAWLNGAFLRCPHCRKIGAWRYDDVEPPLLDKDEDGGIRSSRQLRICRGCGKRVMDLWSDHAGRIFEKSGE